MRAGHLVSALALSVLACGWLTSCADSGDRVLVLGDSITAMDNSDLEADLGADYRFVISGNFGLTTQQVMPEAQTLAERSYDQVIINLGTNDVLQGRSARSAVDTIAQQVAMFDSARCIHVVNVNENMVDQTEGRSASEDARRFNEALQTYVDSQDRVELIDWNAVASQHLSDSEPPTSTLTTDSIHPTQEGNRALNELYAAALGDCPEII